MRATVSKNARSRSFVEQRWDSTSDFINYAAAAGADLMDGEPLEIFNGIHKQDETALRKIATEQRAQALALMSGDMAKRVAGSTVKALADGR